MKLQDYIHYYIGCNVLIDHGTLNEERGRLMGVCSVPNSVNQIYYHIVTDKMVENEDEDFCMPYNDDADGVARIKPYLRPLSSMTEYEMIGLLQSMVPGEMEDKPKDEDYDLEMFYNDGGNMVDGDIAVGANFTCGCFDGQIGVKKCGSIILFDEDEDVTRDKVVNTPMAFHYLLQNHFDLFGLINAGLAIEITIQPTT